MIAPQVVTEPCCFVRAVVPARVIQQTMAKYGCYWAALQADRHGERGYIATAAGPIRFTSYIGGLPLRGWFAGRQLVPSEEVGLGPISEL